jgi:three-Cys-motif partner protein
MGKNIHAEPFDDGTKVKLALYEGYLKEWLPVFVSSKKVNWKTINIFDFFAGEGQDCDGYKGSPLITIEQVLRYERFLSENKVQVNIYFNEFVKKKFNLLEDRLKDYKHHDLFKLHLDNLDFVEAFKKLYPVMPKSDSVNLIFLDQNGIKEITEEVFKKLISLARTDILFFISSSFFTRFAEHEYFQKHLKISKSDIENEKYYSIHRTLFNYYKNIIPSDKKYYLAPLSIKKENNNNIYGLIFGTNHTLGIEKFLKQSWSIDKERGEANFDIDNEKINPTQIGLFSGQPDRPKKTEVFEKSLKEKILNKELKTDYSAYEFALLNGFRPIQAKKVLQELINLKKIENNIKLITSDIHRLEPQAIKLK